ncbi:MAG: division plane positioning ATPase MipZ [Paracoccaceae bacterium]|jgi:chromosome partitioning protein|nr:division plane positioning ATPase MipZ [Paracoccaceae bacterium]MDG1372727.1 division plane positioning ATPase MipZ [Paracoccaceae bacterium]
MSRAHVIVLGNEKGGSGKSTTAMHLFTALVKQGKSVGAMDLDLRQQSFFRYAENRASYAEREGMEMALPEMIKLKNSVLKNRDEALDEEERLFGGALEELQDGNDFILIDCPGTHSYFSQLAHASADTLVTPMNDSLIDFDLLARVDPATHSVLGPSVYSEMVWKARQLRSRAGLKPIDWIVTRNRMSNLHAKNKRKVGTLLEDLAKRIGFRIAPGFSERVIFREMFLNGLTLLDLKGGALSLSHVAARQEVRELLKELNLPGVAASV